jgi:adenine-specific DNA glycosylase
MCEASRLGLETELPVKLRKVKKRVVHQTVVIVEKGDSVLLRRRGADEARLPGFWELPDVNQLYRVRVEGKLGMVRHGITNTDIRVEVVRGSVPKAPRGFRWHAWKQLLNIPLTTIARKGLRLIGVTFPN